MIKKFINGTILSDLKENLLKIQNSDIHETINTIKSVWDMQTLQELLNGKVTIPDHVINGGLCSNRTETAIGLTFYTINFNIHCNL